MIILVLPVPRLLFDRYAASECDAVRLCPRFEHGEVILVDQELFLAHGADDGDRSVAPCFAPFDQIAKGMAVALAEVAQDGFERW